MIDSLSDHLKRKGFEIKENYDLCLETYIKITTVARLVVYPDNVKKLIEVLQILNEIDIPYRVLGRLTNVLFKSPFFNGVVLKTDRINNMNISEDVISLECGCLFPVVAKKLANAGLGGFEGLWGIPGSIGGMVRQNAGAFDYQISDRFVSSLVYDISQRRMSTVNAEDMLFGYRTSILKDKHLILISAELRAEFMQKDVILSLAGEYALRRRQSQPVDKPSLGSVFKKVDGASAGYYIDRCGLKGLRHGGAVVSDKHAGFILNSGGATVDDVISLIAYVKERVLREFGVTLEEEIEVI